MTPELPRASDAQIEAMSTPDHVKTINYSLRFRNIITLYYVTMGVVFGSFFLGYLWGAMGDVGSAVFIFVLILLMLAIGGSPVVICASLFAFIVCVRYLVLNRLSGKQRVVAILTSILSLALTVASTLYFVDLMKNV